MLKRNFFFLMAAMLSFAVSASSQGRVYTIPQTQQAALATNVQCTGTNQDFVVANIGQTQHFVVVAAGSGGALIPPTIRVAILGIDAFGNAVQISDTGYFASSPSLLTGSGYYPKVIVRVSCTATQLFSLTYSGTSSTSIVAVGNQLDTSLSKPLLTGGLAGSSFTTLIASPTGNASGILSFQYVGGTGPANSTLAVACTDAGGVLELYSIPQTPFTVSTAIGIQNWFIPSLPCTSVRVVYTAGGASVNTVSIYYRFISTGFSNNTLGGYTHITGTTATAVKANGGVLLGVNVNTSAAGTVSIFDLPTASCTMTPSTNIVAVLTIGATDPPHATPFNVTMQNGICVKASATMDLTIEYQ